MLDRLNEIILDLKARLDRQPTFGWAVVTSVSPLMIRYDAQDEPIAGTPARLVSVLAIGDRVWCQRQHRRDIILGRGTGLQKSGNLVIPSGALTQIGSTGIWGSAPTFVIPIVAPSDTRIRITAIGTGPGYGWFSIASMTPGLNSTTVAGRFMQIGSSVEQNVHLLWEVVPTK